MRRPEPTLLYVIDFTNHSSIKIPLETSLNQDKLQPSGMSNFYSQLCNSYLRLLGLTTGAVLYDLEDS